LRQRHFRNIFKERRVGDSPRPRGHSALHETNRKSPKNVQTRTLLRPSVAVRKRHDQRDPSEAEHSQTAQRFPSEFRSLVGLDPYDANVALPLGRGRHVRQCARLLLDPCVLRHSDERNLQRAVRRAPLATDPRKFVKIVFPED
jgi:hypothetical protein